MCSTPDGVTDFGSAPNQHQLTDAQVCSTPDGVTDFGSTPGLVAPHSVQGAQRLTASLTSAQEEKKEEGMEEEMCSTPDGVTDFGSLFHRGRHHLPHVRAQRLTASLTSAQPYPRTSFPEQ